MKTIFTYTAKGQHPVKLIYNAAQYDFVVVYGLQRHEQLSLEDAMTELGYCLIHALECTGQLDEYREEISK